MSSPRLRVFLTSSQERTLLLQILATVNQIHLSERQLRRILKKKLSMEKNKKLNKREAKA